MPLIFLYRKHSVNLLLAKDFLFDHDLKPLNQSSAGGILISDPLKRVKRLWVFCRIGYFCITQQTMIRILACRIKFMLPNTEVTKATKLGSVHCLSCPADVYPQQCRHGIHIARILLLYIYQHIMNNVNHIGELCLIKKSQLVFLNTNQITQLHAWWGI